MFMGFIACNQAKKEIPIKKQALISIQQTGVVVLGNVQDAGSPQLGCKKSCCKNLWLNPPTDRKITCLGLYDQKNDKTFIFEASPDFKLQNEHLIRMTQQEPKALVDGIFLTHAHIGHYTGLSFLGRESLSANKMPVYAMPRMCDFLSTNGPWDQLVKIENIVLNPLTEDQSFNLTDQLSVTPFLVPHRDEYSETVGYKVNGPNKSFLFIPDIDKWSEWDRSIIEEISKVDYAFLDATFFNNEEIPNRDMSEIPHPFVEESMDLFKDIPLNEKNKIYFIHFNHTNDLLNPEKEARSMIEKEGYHISEFHQFLPL